MKKKLLYLYYKLLEAKYLFVRLSNVLMQNIRKPLNIQNTNMTIDKLLSGEYSMSRFGDGEVGMLNGESIIFQENSKELTERLREILYDNSMPLHITGLPYSFINRSNTRYEAKVYIEKFIKNKIHIVYKYINKKKKYYDASVTRIYADIKDRTESRGQFEKIKQIWKSKSVLIVEGPQSRLGVGNDFFKHALSIRRIIAPANNAFNKYNEILREVETNWHEGDVVIIALGPTATVLAYDLARLGIRALDMGHIDVEYEWCLMNVAYKVPLKNKVAGDDSWEPHKEINDPFYSRSIVARIL